jgi:hypothetical protein
MAAKKKSKDGPKARVKRPELPRSEPIRSWSTLFGPASGGAPGPLGGASDSVQRGVELGYRVIDEYIRQGSSMAASFTSPRGAQAPSLQDLPQMTERMLRYAADMSSLWFDAMNMMVSNLGAQAGAQASNGGAAPATPGASAPAAPGPAPASAAAAPVPANGSQAAARIVLDVRSPEHTAEVIVALDAAAPEVVVEELRNVSGLDQGAIPGVSLAAGADGATRVRVRVPKGLALGRYSGAVLAAATRRPVGRITVVLGPSDDG